ncbi:MAG: arsenic efflux protein [Atopobiaceae bacterium]|nr:arsenic efflux protein [Atopobiaceae bacterium]
MDAFVDVFVDSALDTVKLIPFLLLTYVVMEAIEHGFAGSSERIIARTDKSGPVVGALLGALPQCGFSAMAATLYAGRVITCGTLVAVILSTSDELIPVFMANQANVGRLGAIIGIKVVIGLITGLIVDVILRALHRAGDGHPHIAELCERAHCHCGVIEDDDEQATYAEHGHDHHGHDHAHGHAHGHDHSHGAHGRWWHILRSACIHTAEVSVFIFVITLCFGLAIEMVGQETMATVFAIHPVRAVFLAALIGLIPNCGASVALAQLFLDGALATGPMLAGLLVSGGMGLLVLFRTNADTRQNVEIAAFVYLVGVACGLAASALGVVI